MSNSIRHRTLSVFGLVLAACLFSLGCASGGGGGAGDTPAGPTALTGGKQVGQISISLGDGVAEDAADVAAQFGILDDLDAGVRRELMGQAWSDSGSLSVDVEIIGLRVRSTGAAIWWGMMAGVDTINARVSVSEKGRSVKTFETGTSTALGGFVYGAQGKRITRMLNTLSKRIATGI